MNEYIKELNEAVKERNQELLQNGARAGAVLLAGVVISGLCVLASKKLKYLFLL